jgi:hypothetical protein
MNKKELRKILIDKINKAYWWHVTPVDPDAYKKRGKFLASSYSRAEFYGRPNMEPERVNILNPVFGYSEKEILKYLFPEKYKDLMLKAHDDYQDDWYEKRIGLDSKMYKQAKKAGFDAIVLVDSTGRKSLEQNRKPRSIELNLLNVC